jgi:hypothetical protein
VLKKSSVSMIKITKPWSIEISIRQMWCLFLLMNTTNAYALLHGKTCPNYEHVNKWVFQMLTVTSQIKSGSIMFIFISIKYAQLILQTLYFFHMITHFILFDYLNSRRMNMYRNRHWSDDLSLCVATISMFCHYSYSYNKSKT